MSHYLDHYRLAACEIHLLGLVEFLVDSLQFSTYKIRSSAKTALPLPSQ